MMHLVIFNDCSGKGEKGGMIVENRDLICSSGVASRRFYVVVIPMISFFLSGCGVVSSQMRVDDLVYGSSLKIMNGNPDCDKRLKELSPERKELVSNLASNLGAGNLSPIIMECVSFRDGEPLHETFRKCDSVSSSEEKKCKSLRNQLQDELFRTSNLICEQHLASITGNAAGWSLGLSTSNAFASALSTASGVAALKTGLSAASSVLGATQTAVSKEVFHEQTAIAIVSAIRKDRQIKEAVIRGDQISKDYADYPVSRAILDVQDYHMACSFYSGLAALVEALDLKKASKVEDVKREIADKNTGVPVVETQSVPGKTDDNKSKISPLDAREMGLREQYKILTR
ncbi:MAG: hypothetical protein H7833_16030 [Magnetococcus sp. DMHC-1]